MATTDALRQRIVDGTIAFGERVLPPFERWIAGAVAGRRRHLLRHRPVPVDRAARGELKLIRSELDAVLERREDLPNFQDISPTSWKLTTDRQLEDLLLLRLWLQVRGQLRALPAHHRTARADPGDEDRDVLGALAGQAHPAHRGPYKGVLRYHLGLKIPEPRSGCRIRVGEDVRHWEEGGSLLFDDTFDHEA